MDSFNGELVAIANQSQAHAKKRKRAAGSATAPHYECVAGFEPAILRLATARSIH